MTPRMTLMECKTGRRHGTFSFSEKMLESVHFFTALSIGVNWLDEPITTWPEIPVFKKLFTFAHNRPVNNESTERMIKQTNDYRNYEGKKEVDFQATLQMVGADIEAVWDSIIHIVMKSIFSVQAKIQSIHNCFEIYTDQLQHISF